MQQNLPGVKLAPRVLISGPSMRLWTLMVSLPAWDEWDSIEPETYVIFDLAKGASQLAWTFGMSLWASSVTGTGLDFLYEQVKSIYQLLFFIYSFINLRKSTKRMNFSELRTSFLEV